MNLKRLFNYARADIKSLKPAYSDLFKNRETVINSPASSSNKSGADGVVSHSSSSDHQSRKRSRTEYESANNEVVVDDVFDEGFRTQQR